MYSYFWEKNKYFFAIIFGAVIIGGFVYFGLLENKHVVIPAKAGIQIASSPSTPFSSANATADARNNAIIKANPTTVTCGAAENTIVTKVIDGDTVVVEGGWHVRLLGMDADEKGYPCYDAAKTRLEDLVLAKQVVLQKDVSDVDQYGRCLRYIFLGNTNVDAQLVQEGLAVARFYAPDVKYRAEITTAETQAQQNKIGCKWSGVQQIR